MWAIGLNKFYVKILVDYMDWVLMSYGENRAIAAKSLELFQKKLLISEYLVVFLMVHYL